MIRLSDDTKTCFNQVRNLFPAANGMTWNSENNKCYATMDAFKHVLRNCTYCKSCIFKGTIMNIKNVIRLCYFFSLFFRHWYADHTCQPTIGKDTGSLEPIGWRINTSEECANLVKVKRDTATSTILQKRDGICFAGYNSTGTINFDATDFETCYMKSKMKLFYY